MKIYGDEVQTNEKAFLYEMQQACPRFFKNPNGKRETHTVYRGCLIVRYTVRFSHGSERKTAAYLFLPNGHEDGGRPDLFCVSVCTDLRSIAGAKRYIDRLLEHGEYEYGWQRATSAI